MTIPNSVNKTGPLDGNGVTTAFSGTFKIDDQTHVKVIKTSALGVETVLTIATDYTVSGVGVDAGFTVTALVAPASGTVITLILNVPFTQQLNLVNQGAYNADDVEAALDRGVQRDLQIMEEVSRAVKLPVSGDTADLDLLVTNINALGAVADDVATVAGMAAAISAAPAIADAIAADEASVAANKALVDIAKAAADADVVLTHADVVLTNADVVAAEAARAAAVVAKDAAVVAKDAAVAAAGGLTTVPVQIAAATDEAFADDAMLTARKADGTLIKRSWLNVKGQLPGGAGGFRSKLINGDFDFWQRATSQTATGYGSDDRWANVFVGGSLTHSRQTFTLGQTDVPGNPEYFSRSVVTHAVAVGNLHAKIQKIEDVRSLAGKTVTVTFLAKADAAKNMAVELYQDFGTGGSPSTAVSTPAGLKALTTSWQKFSFTVAVPSISGKTLGSNANDSLQLYFWFESGATNATRASSIGQQSGTFDIAHVSIVEGDATAEADPFSPRHLQQELAQCQRYYETAFGIARFPAASGGQAVETLVPWKVTKRATPTCAIISSSTLSNVASSVLARESTTGVGLVITSTSSGETYNLNAVISGESEL